MFEKFLVELGLSEKETAIYLALLQYESASIQEIATKTKINRTTVYPVLESLQKKGLVSEVQDGKKTEYHAEPPERLETFVERQRVVLEEHSERLRDVIPQIKSIQREQGERPIVKFFQGRDGSIAAYEEFFSFPESIEKKSYAIFSDDMLHNVFTEDEISRFRKIRKNKNVTTSIVYTRKAGDREFEKNNASKRIDETKYPLTCDITIIDDTVVISTLGKDVASILIKSKDIAETLKTVVRYICDTK